MEFKDCLMIGYGIALADLSVELLIFIVRSIVRRFFPKKKKKNGEMKKMFPVKQDSVEDKFEVGFH